jgi:ketosteroid isomerase-like protein
MDTPRAMSRENVDRLRSLYADWAEGNFWTTGDYVDSEVEFEWTWAFAEIGRMGPEGRAHGLEELTAVWQDWLKPWEKFTVEADEFVDIDDDRVLVLYRRRAKLRGADSTIDHKGGTVWTLRDGMAVRIVDFDDRAKALEAVGVERDAHADSS